MLDKSQARSDIDRPISSSKIKTGLNYKCLALKTKISFDDMAELKNTEIHFAAMFLTNILYNYDDGDPENHT